MRKISIRQQSKKSKHQVEPFQSYADLFVQRIPRYAVKTSRTWTTKNKPLSDRPVQAHLAGQYAVAVLGKWYPEHALLDIDNRPRGMVDEIREKLELDEKNSMLFTSESPNSCHLLVRPEYKEKPPTLRLLNNAFRNFCRDQRIEVYPQAERPIRLPFGPRQIPLDPEYSGLESWEDKLFWFQKLNSFDLREVRGQQFVFDFAPSEKPALPSLTGEAQFLLRHGLQAPSSRYDAQFKIIYFLWRRNVPIETAEEITFSWIRRKHNGFSKDIIRYPRRVKAEIERQAACIYEKYELAKTYPDSTHNLFNGFITRADLEKIVRIAQGSLPRMRLLFNLVKFFYPRRFRTFISVHTDKLLEWASNRTYLKYLIEFEGKGILKRGTAYQTSRFSKNIRLDWQFLSSSDEAVLYDGRAVESFEGTIKLIFKPDEMRQLLEAAGAKVRWSYKLKERIWRSESL